MIAPARKALTLALIAALIAALAIPSVALAKQRGTRRSPGVTATQKASKGHDPAKSSNGKSADAGRASQQQSQSAATGEAASDAPGSMDPAPVMEVKRASKKAAAASVAESSDDDVAVDDDAVTDGEDGIDDGAVPSEEASRGVANAYTKILTHWTSKGWMPPGIVAVLAKFAARLGLVDEEDETPPDGEDGTVDDGTVDDGTVDDGTVDDGTTADDPGTSDSFYLGDPPVSHNEGEFPRVLMNCSTCHNVDGSLIIPAPSS